MRYNAETTQGTRLGEGEWDSLSERLNKMRRGRFLKESLQQDRKDALTRCPLDFDQEEKTRKAETSKWLEHHFGSESNSRSSRDSDDEGTGKGHQTGYINVTMKSAKEPNKQSQASTPNGKGVFLSSPEPEKVYFKGISEWKSEERKYPVTPPARGVQVLPTGPNHTFNANSVPVVASSTKPPTPPLAVNGGSPHHRSHNHHHQQQQHVERTSHSPLNHHHQVTKSTKYYERNCSPYDRGSPMYRGSSSPVLNKLNGKASPPTREHTPPTVSPPHRRRTRRSEREEEPLREEPAPDYSPVSEPRSSPHRITPDVKRKVYQRTRFAADIPPPSSHHHSSHHHQQQYHHNHHNNEERKTNGKGEGKRGGLGQSFRRLVGKLRSASGERNDKNNKKNNNKANSSKKGGDNSSHHHHHHHDEGVGMTRVVDSGTQTGSDMHSLHTRLYLGHESPFTSYPSKESSDYDHGYRRKYRREEDRQHSSSQGSSTLGRLSKSTGRLSSGISGEQQRHHQAQNTSSPATTVYYNDRGGVQTLPRKLQEHKHKKEVQVTRSSGESSLGSGDRYTRLGNNSSSMFNVSIVNNVSSSGGYHQANGTPVKPARAYKSNLLRSKSFNVHAGEPGHYQSGKYTSNPHLHRLDESHAPLKSPGIVTSISRSTRDISEALHEEDERPGGYENNRYAKANGYHHHSRSNVDTKKKMLMKQLMDRAPDLYRSVHENGSPLNERLYSFGSGSDLTRRVVRRGSNDYTETVSFTNKSDDPVRPSVTNTVQSFTKKTVPTPGGGHRKETIESTETKTITKSRFRTGTPDLKYIESDNNKYSNSNGGVIIEVRNTRK